MKAAYSPAEAGEAEPDATVSLTPTGRLLGYGFILSILVVGALPGSVMALFTRALAWVV